MDVVKFVAEERLAETRVSACIKRATFHPAVLVMVSWHEKCRITIAIVNI